MENTRKKTITEEFYSCDICGADVTYGDIGTHNIKGKDYDMHRKCIDTALLAAMKPKNRVGRKVDSELYGNDQAFTKTSDVPGGGRPNNK